MAKPTIRAYKVFFTWVNDRGIRRAGYTLINARSAKQAEEIAKRERRPFKIHNVEAKLYA